MWLICLLFGLSTITSMRIYLLQMLNIRLAYLYQFYYENSNEIHANMDLKGLNGTR